MVSPYRELRLRRASLVRFSLAEVQRRLERALVPPFFRPFLWSTCMEEGLSPEVFSISLRA